MTSKQFREHPNKESLLKDGNVVTSDGWEYQASYNGLGVEHRHKAKTANVWMNAFIPIKLTTVKPHRTHRFGLKIGSAKDKR